MTTPTQSQQPQTTPAFPCPARSSVFWYRAICATGAAMVAALLIVLMATPAFSTVWPVLAYLPVAMAGSGFLAWAGNKGSAAEEAELLAALSNRYGVPVTRVGDHKWGTEKLWDVGGKQVAAIVGPGPVLVRLDAEPAPTDN